MDMASLLNFSEIAEIIKKGTYFENNGEEVHQSVAVFYLKNKNPKKEKKYVLQFNFVENSRRLSVSIRKIDAMMWEVPVSSVRKMLDSALSIDEELESYYRSILLLHQLFKAYFKEQLKQNHLLRIRNLLGQVKIEVFGEEMNFA